MSPINLKMLLKLLVLSAIAVLTAGRRAPNADYLEELLKSKPQNRFSNNVEKDALLDAPGLIERYGYPQETHQVITSDGYILEAHRIPHGRDNFNKPGDRPAVLLMHGLLSSSADFLVLGPGNALAYLLAEEGYDVWLANARGNFYSRKHRRLNPNNVLVPSFWHFSWDEIGNYDLPAFVDYILKNTGQKKLHFIGHSQGGTAFLVLNSLRPEYNDKFISFQGLAPASFFTNNNVSIFNSMATYESVIENTAFLIGRGEVFANRDFIDWFRTSYCVPGSIFESACNSFGSLESRPYVNSTMVPLFLAHVPAGASIRQFAHYAQVIRFNAFRRYNFNRMTNLRVYGRVNPPEYNLRNVKVQSYIHYGHSDREVHYKDIGLLKDALPNAELYRVERPTFNHYDFIWAMDVKNLVYHKVVNCMRDAESKQ